MWRRERDPPQQTRCTHAYLELASLQQDGVEPAEGEQQLLVLGWLLAPVELFLCQEVVQTGQVGLQPLGGLRRHLHAWHTHEVHNEQAQNMSNTYSSDTMPGY